MPLASRRIERPVKAEQLSSTTSAKTAMPTQHVVEVCCIHWFGWLVEGPSSILATVGTSVPTAANSGQQDGIGGQ